MDRRFICQDCRTKWFIHEDRAAEPDLTECGRCGGQLVTFDGGAAGGDGSGEATRASWFGEDGQAGI